MLAPLRVLLLAVPLAALTARGVGADELQDITRRIQELQGKARACGTDAACIQPYLDEMMRLGQQAAELSEERYGTPEAGASGAQPSVKVPPELERLLDKSNRVTLDLDPLTQCDEINRGTEEILEEIRGRVSPQIKGAFVHIRFCAKTEVTIQQSIHHRTNAWDVSLQTESRLEAAWADTFLVRPGTEEAHHIDSVLQTGQPEKTRGGTRLLKVSGGLRTARSPFSRGEVDGGAWLQIRPIEWVLPLDANDFPETLFSRFAVETSNPWIKLFPHVGQEGFPTAFMCLQNPASDFVYLEPEELQAGIERGQLRVVMEGVSSDPHCISDTRVITVGAPPGDCDPAVTSPEGAVALDGDCLDHGGPVLAGDDKVLVNGRKVARVGDPALCRIHGVTRIARSGPSSVFAAGDPVARIGDVTECGAKIVGGSLDTFVGRP